MVPVLSNLTLDEALKFYELPQPVLDAIERERQVWQLEASELEETEREELLHEQIYFARELIDSIEIHAGSHTVMKEFRAKLRVLLDDTSFER